MLRFIRKKLLTPVIHQLLLTQEKIDSINTKLDEINAKTESTEHIEEPQSTETSLIALSTLKEVYDLHEQASINSKTEEERVNTLSNYYHAPIDLNIPSDPFSQEYRDFILKFYREIYGENYSVINERLDIDVDSYSRRPNIYRIGGSRFLGAFLEAIGQILQVADVPQGARVIEYGPGEGQIALAFARLGCDVTVVDIEPRYHKIIQKQAEMLDLEIKCIEGEFTQPVDGKYDCIVFFEAFHHALDHLEILESLQGMLTENGKIIFSGEPILARDDYWSPTLPYPWGLRLDALSLCAIKTYGWLELGYQESYFYEILSRTGLSGCKITSPTNLRGTCYVATKSSQCQIENNS